MTADLAQGAGLGIQRPGLDRPSSRGRAAQEIAQNGATTEPLAMFATLGGSLALLLGLVVLLVPLLTPELSRARDAVWGAVLLLLGLVLVTSSDRLGGSPMVAVLCGGLMIGRLGSEVGQQRWRALTPEEQERLGSGAHWRTALGQVLASLGALQGMASQSLSGLLARLPQRLPQVAAGTPTAIRGMGKGKGKAGGQAKRWVRPEPSATGTPETTPQIHPELSESDSEMPTATPAAVSPEPEQPPVIEVSSFTEIAALVDAAWGETPDPAQALAEPAPEVAIDPPQPEDASLANAVNPSSPIPPQEPAEASATPPRNDAG